MVASLKKFVAWLFDRPFIHLPKRLTVDQMRELVTTENRMSRGYVPPEKRTKW